ncbi:MAG: hypothetical protein ACK5MZ_06760 [Aestuariibaculum sp.]
MLSINKQILFLIFFFVILYVNAQEETVYYGSPSTRGAEFHFKKDNTYKIVLKQGKYNKIDTGRETIIYLDDIGYDIEGFNVTEDYSKTVKDSITVNFYRRNLHSDYDKYYLGFKTNGDKNFTYLNLSYETLLFNTKNVKPFNFNGFLSIKIPRATEIQLILEDEVETEKKEKYFMNQFSLSKKTANVYVDYRKIEDKNNSHDSKFAVAEIYGSGRKILDIDSKAFSAALKPSTYVKRTKVDSFPNNWEVPELVKKEVYKKFNNPKYVYQPVFTISPAPRNEKYKKHEFGQLKEAITAIKADESKLLLVFNSILRHNDAAYFYHIFDGIYSGAEKLYLSDYNYDKFYVYYIKPEDLPELKKYRLESNDEVFGLNSNLDIVYSEKTTTRDFYYKYNSINKKLSEKLLAVNVLNRFKRKLDTKNTTAKDFLYLRKYRYHNIINSAIEGSMSLPQEVVSESERISPKPKSNAQYFYPQINYQEIREELNRIVEKHKKDTTINFDFAKLALYFIYGDMFFESISGEEGSYAPTKIYYEFCLYLSRFPIETSKVYNEFSERYGENPYNTIREILKSNYGEKDKYPDLIKAINENLDKIKKVD